MKPTGSVEILLVEDDPQDLDLTLRALRLARLTNNIRVARDGAEALDYIFGEGPWAGLTLDSRGILYGVTEEGGQYGAGVVFAIKP